MLGKQEKRKKKVKNTWEIDDTTRSPIPNADDRSFDISKASSSTPPPPVLHNSSGFVSTGQSGDDRYFYIKSGAQEFPVKQSSETKNTVLIEERYDKSLADWIEEKPNTMHLAFKNSTKIEKDEQEDEKNEKWTLVNRKKKRGARKTPVPDEEDVKDNNFEKLVPTEDAIMVVRGLLTAFFDLLNTKEKHHDLKHLGNYLLTSPIFDYHSPSGDEYANGFTSSYTTEREILNSAGEYTRKVKVIIIRDSKHVDATTDLEDMTAAIIDIIFNRIFDRKNNLPEWDDLRNALTKKKFEYADAHPCLWSWKKRLLFYVDLSSHLSNRGPDINRITYDAVRKIKLDVTDLSEQDLRERKELTPLRKVLDHNHPEPHTGDVARLAKPTNLIRFMKNCYSHLTERYWNTNTGMMEYSNIDLKDNVYYQDLRFLNHLVTYKLYPDLLIKLFANLHESQYRF